MERLLAGLIARVRPRQAAACLLLLALVLPLLPAVSAGAQTPSSAHDMHEEYFESLDGTLLHAYVFRPKWVGNAQTPAILSVSPYHNTGGHIVRLDVDPFGEPGGFALSNFYANTSDAFREGYTLVAVALRGSGASRGCPDLGGPGEQADARAAVEWVRAQPWSNGKVGVTGFSYPALGSLLTMALRDDTYHGPDVAVWGAAPSGYEQVFENRVAQHVVGGLPPGWVAGYNGSSYLPASVHSDLAHFENYVARLPQQPGCLAQNVPGNNNPDPETHFWRARDMSRLLDGATVPVLAVHGFEDDGVPAKQLFPVVEGLAGPWHAIIGPWVHVGANARQTVMPWLNQHLKDEPLPDHPLWDNRWMVQLPDRSWRGEGSWPPADVQGYTLPLQAGVYLDTNGNMSETGPPPYASGRTFDLPVLPVHGRGVWTFSPAAPYPVHLSGRARLSVQVETVASGAHLIGLLYEVRPNGDAHLITRGAYKITEPGATEVSFELRPHDRRLEAGSRIGLLVTSADDWYYASGNTGQPVQVLGGWVSLPLLRYDRASVFLPADTIGIRTWTGYDPFQVDSATIEQRTADVPPPPPMEPFPQEPECWEPGRPSQPGRPDEPVCRP